MTATLLPVPKARFYDASGDPLAGGKVYTYAAGGTTPKASYTDSGAGTPNANPVILDANGEANIWIDGLYKIELQNSAGVQQWVVDNVSNSFLASPAFTGTPTAPTAAPGTLTSQIATTSFVGTSFAPIASATLTGVPAAPTAAADTSTTQLATTAYVLGQTASQAEMEAASSTTKYVSPGRAKYHPGMCKAWCLYHYSAGTPTIDASYNVTSLTDNGTGDATVNMTVAFSTANYCVLGGMETTGFHDTFPVNVSVMQSKAFNTSAVATDVTGGISIAAFGDQ